MSTLAITRESNINGLPHGVTTSEQEALWGDCPYLRPRAQREWLSHFIALEFGLARLLAGWIPGCGHIDWKIELPRLLFEHMQRVRRLRERLAEIPGGTGAVRPSPKLKCFLTEVGRADSGRGFVHALLHQVMPALARAYLRYEEQCDEVFDAPTLYFLRINRTEIEDTLIWGRQFLATQPLAIERELDAEAYAGFVKQLIARCQGLLPELGSQVPDLRSPIADPPGPNPKVRCNDSRLRLRQGFPPTREGNPTHGTLREIVYHNATEWQVIDPMCEVFYGLVNMPTEFFVDFSRHIWDECRHARMGIRRLIELGYSLSDFEWTHGENRISVLEDYFAGLTMIGEACSFTRKKGSIPYFLRNRDVRSAMLPEVDCVDEQLHVGFGHKWVPKIYEQCCGQKRTKDAIAVDQRRRFFEQLVAAPSRHEVGEMLGQLSQEAREELVNSFSGFCGAIEYKLDFTVY